MSAKGAGIRDRDGSGTRARTGRAARRRVDPVHSGQTGAALPAVAAGTEPVGVAPVTALSGKAAQDARDSGTALPARATVAEPCAAGAAVTTGRSGSTETADASIANQDWASTAVTAGCTLPTCLLYTK
ncbi:hypothetical protein A4G27_24450, partial [Mycobacterium kansasii]